MTMQDIISKVQKLRRLATSSNVHEAAAAAAAADRLIQEHRLHESEIEAQAGAVEEKPTEDFEPLIVGTRTHTATWRYRLALNLAHHYDVACYSSWRKNASGQVDRTLHLIGRKSDVETMRYQDAYFTLEIERLARASGLRGRAALNSFRLGAVSGLFEAMRASKQAVMQEARQDASVSKQSAAIVLASRYGDAKSARDKLHPDLKGGRAVPSNVSNYEAFSAGRRAGAGLYTGGQIAGGGTGRALGPGGKVSP